MAQDLTRKAKHSYKKHYSVASAILTKDQILDNTAHDLFNIPRNSLITNSYIIVEEPGQASLTLSMGIKGVSGIGLFNAKAADAAALTVYDAKAGTAGTGTTPNIVSTVRGPDIATGTGKTVTATFSAVPTAGRFVAIVEYLEYTLGNGEYMNITPA